MASAVLSLFVFFSFLSLSLRVSLFFFFPFFNKCRHHWNPATHRLSQRITHVSILRVFLTLPSHVGLQLGCSQLYETSTLYGHVGPLFRPLTLHLSCFTCGLKCALSSSDDLTSPMNVWLNSIGTSSIKRNPTSLLRPYINQRRHVYWIIWRNGCDEVVIFLTFSLFIRLPYINRKRRSGGINAPALDQILLLTMEICCKPILCFPHNSTQL